MPVNSHPKIDLDKVTPAKKAQTVRKVGALREELQAKNASWQAKETPQSFLKADQKKSLLGVVPDKQFSQEVKALAASGPMGILPAFVPEVDWRTSGKVSPVKDQGTCGSCVSFGTAGMIEAMALIECNTDLDLSEADLHFRPDHGENCNGWYPNSALWSVKQRGVTDEVRFPYASAFVNGAPHYQTAPDRAQHLYNYTSSCWQVFDAYRKDYLTHKGPMTACFTVYDDFFSYGSGVYRHISGGRAGGHCVLVIGYSEAEGCWICKNSWGTAWGDNGFFKIAYRECGIDSLLSPFFGVEGVTLP